jgi:hypothetical protein
MPQTSVPFIVPLLTLMAVPSAGAQQSPSMTIDGFRGVEWGAEAEAVISLFGDPEEDRLLERDLRMLAYRDTLVGQSSVVLLGFLPGGGFQKAQVVVNALKGQECIDQIRSIHSFVDLQYPLIHPTEEARNNTPYFICDAAEQGQAHWHRQWHDQSTGSVVSVRLDSGTNQINLIYESLAFREWVGEPLAEVPDQADSVEESISPVPE